MVMVWYSTFTVARDWSNPPFLLMNPDALKEPRKVKEPFSRVSVCPAGPLLSHTIPFTSNDSRQVNNLKNAKNVTSSNKQPHSFSSETVSARELKYALNEASSKRANEMAVRVRDLRLVNVEKWD